MLIPSLRGDDGILWRRLALVLWAALLGGSCIRCIVSGAGRDVGIFAVYAQAGRHWATGVDLYPTKDAWESFLYSPAVAAMLVPYSILPATLGNIFWRLTVGGSYLVALRWWVKAVLPVSLSHSQVALVFLLVLPVTAMTMLDGQAGGLVATSMLCTIAAAATDRWGFAAAFAALGCLLKVYPIALLLLLVACYPRRAALPAVVALATGAALPFLCQRPSYVIDQYGKWLAMMAASDRLTWSLDIANRDIALLFRVWGSPPSQATWSTVQLSAAVVAAALCVAARWAGWSRQSLLLLLQGMAACWMTLFGPVVESFTYILVGPTLAWSIVEAWQLRRNTAYRGLLVASWVMFASTTLAIIFMHSIRYHRLGPHPVAGLMLLTALLIDAGKRFAATGTIIREKGRTITSDLPVQQAA